MARIAVGGCQHETNVFAPYLGEYEVFAQRYEWPPLSRGQAMLDEVYGINLPVTGSGYCRPQRSAFPGPAAKTAFP